MQLSQLTTLVQGQSAHPVRSGVLEAGELSLTAQVQQVIAETQCTELVVVPLFLVPGNHVERDLPEALAVVGPWVQTRTIGESRALVEILASQATDQAQLILFVHGSRRIAAQTPILKLQAQLSERGWPTQTVFHQQDPHRLPQLLAQARGPGLVLPLFLFTGGLTDWAAEQVQAYPGWTIAPPLGLGKTLLPVLTELLAPDRMDESPRAWENGDVLEV